MNPWTFLERSCLPKAQLRPETSQSIRQAGRSCARIRWVKSGRWSGVRVVHFSAFGIFQGYRSRGYSARVLIDWSIWDDRWSHDDPSQLPALSPQLRNTRFLRLYTSDTLSRLFVIPFHIYIFWRFFACRDCNSKEKFFARIRSVFFCYNVESLVKSKSELLQS